jgi:hypothetical protein
MKTLTPKTAARLMIAGSVLVDDHGWIFFWNDSQPGFQFEDEEGKRYPVNDFSGLRMKEKQND